MFEVQYYLCVDITARCSNLLPHPLTEYQEFLHKTIFDLRKDGLTFNQIADWLNAKGHKTPRNHKFKGTHVFGILKKKQLRDERNNKPYELTLSEWYEKDVKRSP
ncbi:MAG: hypothetical protein HN775_04035 [Hellea sp.]|nr:hypothetical protein [Hellea sp.]